MVEAHDLRTLRQLIYYLTICSQKVSMQTIKAFSGNINSKISLAVLTGLTFGFQL